MRRASCAGRASRPPGPDLHDLVDERTRLSARAGPRTAPASCACSTGNLPVYLCWLRDDAEQLIGSPRGRLPAERRPGCRGPQFLFRPCAAAPGSRMPAPRPAGARRHRRAQRTRSPRSTRISSCCWPTALSERPAGDGADELKGILQQAIEHLRCATGALIVPDKSIALVRSSTQRRRRHAARRARAPAAAVDGADAPRARDHQQARSQRHRGNHAVSHSVLPAALRRRPHDRRARAVPRGAAPRISSIATRASATVLARKARGRHREQLTMR